jgi:hypothetical protein
LQEQEELKDTPFTNSLKKTAGKSVMKKLKPVLARHQKMF